MNPVAILNTPFVQVALPIVVTFIVAAWLNGKRLEDFRIDVNRRFDDHDQRFNESRSEMVNFHSEMIMRFDRLESMLGDHNQRIVVSSCAKVAQAPRSGQGYLYRPLKREHHFRIGRQL